MTLTLFLEAHPVVFTMIAGFIGLMVGSFLNVVIHRLPIMMEREWTDQCKEFLEQTKDQATDETFNLSVPRSHCPTCKHAISVGENIPVLSYLMLGGKCKNCQTKISKRYPFVELFTAILTAVVAFHFGFGWAALGAMLLTWALIALSGIDIDHQLLPDSITLPFLWLGLLFNLSGTYVDLQTSVIGAMAGYLSLWSVYMLFKLVTGKEGMGFGDFKLLAVLGAWLGWQSLPLIIILSSLVGAIFGVAMIVFKSHGRSQPIPFGPYLAAAGWLALCWGNDITDLYLNWAVR